MLAQGLYCIDMVITVYHTPAKNHIMSLAYDGIDSHTFKLKISYFAFQYYLMLDGRGNYEYKQITEETSEFGS